MSETPQKIRRRLDYVAAENSMGFHAPQEAARILGTAADLARQGQVAALRWRTSVKATERKGSSSIPCATWRAAHRPSRSRDTANRQP